MMMTRYIPSPELLILENVKATGNVMGVKFPSSTVGNVTLIN